MTTAIPTDELLEETAPGPEAAAAVSTRSLFKYSEFLDIGEGAAECEHARDGQCEDPEHFHAWCRLPNPFQHEDIREKALAAKARKLRELRDPESNASIVLDEDLASVADLDLLIDELLVHGWAQDYIEARDAVEEREEFAHIAQDREEFERLKEAEADLPEEEQSEDFKRLTAHVTQYLDAIRAELEERQAPRREELRAAGREELVRRVRAKRVDDVADRAFIETYQAWMWFVGTFNVALHPTLKRPHVAMWEQIGHRDRPAAGTMFGEMPEVISGLKVTFNALELAMQRGSAGN